MLGENSNSYIDTLYYGNQITSNDIALVDVYINSSGSIISKFSVKEPYINKRFAPSYLMSDISVKEFTSLYSAVHDSISKLTYDNFQMSSGNVVAARFYKTGSAYFNNSKFDFTNKFAQTCETDPITADKVSVYDKSKSGNYTCTFKLKTENQQFKNIGTGREYVYSAVLYADSNQMSVETGAGEVPSDESLKLGISSWSGINSYNITAMGILVPTVTS